MFNGKYISIKSILSDIIKYPYVEGLSAEDVASYLAEFLRIVGAPIVFNNKPKEIEVKNYRADLPQDMIYIRGIRYAPCKVKNKDSYIPMTYASNVYHSGLHCQDNINEQANCSSKLSYNINNSYIETSEKEGTIQISYQSIKTDEEGLPMIPDDVKLKMALKYFILWQYAEPAYYRKDVPRDIYNDIKTQYFWYIGAASNSLNMPSPDQMKTLENGIIRLVKSSNQHETGWKNFNSKERINNGN